MNSMTPRRWERIKQIFATALEQPAERREAFLAEQCGDDPALAAEILELLAHHDDASQAEPTLPADAGPQCPADDAHRSMPSLPRIGPYRLIRPLGEGGMGTVYLAERQHPFHQTVAIKLIKAGMDSKQVIARFESERQALGVMNHPNVAAVYDAGMTDELRPYFVMEYVPGEPITSFCDRHNYTTKQRLELFIQACEAIQHAHTKAIIHRDIKPSNLMVMMQEDKPLLKVIDFGVAKAVSQRLTERTLFTEQGQLIGTPEYMSPEQAEMNPRDVDTRTDIYSLGVVLYELLAGAPPFDPKSLREAAYNEIQRTIREVDPPRPSARLSELGPRALLIAKHRDTQLATLERELRHELEWIPLKALRKDRSQRYHTVTELAQDVGNYLAGHALMAGPESPLYRAKKFVFRHVVGVAAIVAVTLALAIGMTVATVGVVQARRQAARADREAAKATAVSGFLQNMLESANPEQAQADYSVRQLLDDFSVGPGAQLAGQPEVEAEVRLTIGRAYRRLQVFDRAESNFQMALDLSRRAFGPEHEKVAECLIDYGWNLANQKRAVEAEKIIQEALRIYRLRNIRGQAYVKGLWILQQALLGAGREGEEEAVTQEALAVADATPGIEFPELASILHRHAGVLLTQNQSATAEQWARRSVEMHRRLHGDEHPETGWGLKQLGRALQAQGKLAEAESAQREALAIFRKRFGDANQATTYTLTDLKKTLKAQGKTSELDALILELVESARKTENRKEAEAWFQRGQALIARRQWDAAAIAYEQAMELTGGIGAEPGTGPQLTEAAQAAVDSGNRNAALKLFPLASSVLERDVAANPSQHQTRLDLNTCYIGYSEAFHIDGKIEDSLRVMQKAIAALDRAMVDLPAARQRFLVPQGHNYRYLGFQHGDLRHYAAARAAYAASSEVFRQYDETTSPGEKPNLHWRADNSRWIASLWEAENRGDEAHKAYREALARYEAVLTEGPASALSIRWANEDHDRLAQVLEKSGTVEDALRIGPKLRPPGPELNPQGLRGLAACHLQVAGLLQRGGRAQEAKEAYRRVVDLYTKLAADSSDNPSMFWRSASASCELCKLLQATGRSAEAIEICLKAAQRCHAMMAQYEKIAPDRNFSADCRNFAIQCEAVGQLLSGFGRDKEGEGAYRDALAIFRKLQGEDSRDVAEATVLLARSLDAERKFPQAEVARRDALAVWRRLVDREPRLANLRSGVGELTWALADMLERLGRPDEAVATWRDALAVYERARRDFPDEPFFRQEVAYTHWRLAQTFDSSGRIDEAIAAERDAIGVLLEAIAVYPDWGSFKQRLSTSRSHLMTLLLRAGRSDEAAQLLGDVSRAPGTWSECRDAAAATAKIMRARQRDAHLSDAERKSAEDAANANIRRLLATAVESCPAGAGAENELAWFLVASSDPLLRDAAAAVMLAQRGVEHSPNDGMIWNTLGVARYRNGQWKDAITALEKSIELRKGGDSYDWFFLSMAHLQLDEKEAARKWYDQACAWMEKNQPANAQLRRFRTETEELLNINGQKPTTKPESK